MFQKLNILEYLDIGLPQISLFKISRYLLQECILFMIIQLTLHLERLLNVIADFALQFLIYCVIFHHRSKRFSVVVSLRPLSPQIVNEITHTVDIIGQTDAAHHLN